LFQYCYIKFNSFKTITVVTNSRLWQPKYGQFWGTKWSLYKIDVQGYNEYMFITNKYEYGWCSLCQSLSVLLFSVTGFVSFQTFQTIFNHNFCFFSQTLNYLKLLVFHFKQFYWSQFLFLFWRLKQFSITSFVSEISTIFTPFQFQMVNYL